MCIWSVHKCAREHASILVMRWLFMWFRNHRAYGRLERKLSNKTAHKQNWISENRSTGNNRFPSQLFSNVTHILSLRFFFSRLYTESVFRIDYYKLRIKCIVSSYMWMGCGSKKKEIIGQFWKDRRNDIINDVGARVLVLVCVWHTSTSNIKVYLNRDRNQLILFSFVKGYHTEWVNSISKLNECSIIWNDVSCLLSTWSEDFSQGAKWSINYYFSIHKYNKIRLNLSNFILFFKIFVKKVVEDISVKLRTKSRRARECVCKYPDYIQSMIFQRIINWTEKP